MALLKYMKYEQLQKSGNQRDGRSFTPADIQAVWEKGRTIRGKDPELYRRDACGAIIYRASHGKRTPMGWEIDHIRPVSKNGTDDLYNLQPLQWENNRHKGDNYPYYTCAVRA
jgi:hypothetical protein